MPQSFNSVIIHYVFGTKHREPWLTKDVCARLYPFVGSVLKERDCKLLTIGGMPDHMHSLVSMHADWAPAPLMRELKAVASKWFHNTFGKAAFAWQRGYGAFSVSISNVKRVTRYIETQEEHHLKKSYREELVEFLKGHGISYDERDLDD
jgi:putative transposase